MKATLREYSLALCSGVLLALSFPKWHLYLLAWVALAPLFHRTHPLNPARAFKHFFVAGCTFYLLLLQWLLANVYWAGGWAVVGYMALVVFMALYWALTGLTWAWLQGRVSQILWVFSIPILWAAMEFLQARLFTGFGWGAVAYSQGKDLALLQWAAIGGAPSVSAIVVLMNALVAWALTSPRRRRLAIVTALAVAALSHGIGAVLLGEADYAAKPLKVGLFQADFPLEMKWDMEYTVEMVRNAAEKSRTLVQNEPVDLIVWPESLIMDSVEAPGIRELVLALARDTGCAIFTGAERLDATSGAPRNSSVLISNDGRVVDHYDKLHLAPFGEYVPFAKYLGSIRKLVPIVGDIEPGAHPKVLPVGDRRFGPLICFEVLFADMTENLRRQDADFLVVLTNLGWFGASNAIPQELEIARVRAVETRLPLVHSSNTGISGTFDPWGRFTLVDAEVDAWGRYYKWEDRLRPEQTIMRRHVGAMAVAVPGTRPIPYGPRVIPALMVLVTLALITYAAFFGHTREHAQETPDP